MKWDFKKYYVCNFSKHLLDSIWQQPIFNVSSINKALYTKSKEMDRVRVSGMDFLLFLKLWIWDFLGRALQSWLSFAVCGGRRLSCLFCTNTCLISTSGTCPLSPQIMREQGEVSNLCQKFHFSPSLGGISLIDFSSLNSWASAVNIYFCLAIGCWTAPEVLNDSLILWTIRKTPLTHLKVLLPTRRAALQKFQAAFLSEETDTCY